MNSSTYSSKFYNTTLVSLVFFFLFYLLVVVIFWTANHSSFQVRVEFATVVDIPKCVCGVVHSTFTKDRSCCQVKTKQTKCGSAKSQSLTFKKKREDKILVSLSLSLSLSLLFSILLVSLVLPMKMNDTYALLFLIRSYRREEDVSEEKRVLSRRRKEEKGKTEECLFHN